MLDLYEREVHPYLSARRKRSASTIWASPYSPPRSAPRSRSAAAALSRSRSAPCSPRRWGGPGLDDFGADDFRERLALWLSAMDEDVHAPGSRARRSGTTAYARCDPAAAPGAAEGTSRVPRRRARRPIIVVGLPRSGTTHLVNLIAADARLRSLPLWESLEPCRIRASVRVRTASIRACALSAGYE